MLYGESFFAGRVVGGKNPEWNWFQQAGINAGLMLFRPSQKVFRDIKACLIEPYHPGLFGSGGPEQDFLSRYFADVWSHLGVEYNYQLHQIYQQIYPQRDQRQQERKKFLTDPNELKIIHFSGPSKPWDQVTLNSLKIGCVKN